MSSDSNILIQLRKIAGFIDSHSNWWRFPTEGSVRGFLGTDPLFIVGDQPSTSEWGPTNPNRRLFYDLLIKVGSANAHLTDLYKRRGKSGELRKHIPEDFGVHLDLFRSELSIIQPCRVVALGHLAFHLLSVHVPEIKPILGRMWHFSYVNRSNRQELYESNMNHALYPQSKMKGNLWVNSVL